MLPFVSRLPLESVASTNRNPTLLPLTTPMASSVRPLAERLVPDIGVSPAALVPGKNGDA
jgi:hypothetical protein